MSKPDPQTTEDEEITLKWGTLKGWYIADDNKEAMELLDLYHKLGVCISAAAQKDTDEQKQILIGLVSLPNMKIYLDWDSKYITKNEAIEYIQGYGRGKAP